MARSIGGVVLQLTPTTKDNRIDTLDVLRGISLLGILLVNITSFNYPTSYVRLSDFLSTPSDLHSEQMLSIFIQGSFYPLFAWLFGYGIQMQKTKADLLERSYVKPVTKRLTVLLFIGLLHAVFIWYGDILVTYAVFGFVLVLLINLKPAIKLIVGTTLFTVFNGFLLWAYWKSDTGSEGYGFYADITNVKNSLLAYGEGSWLDAFQQRLVDLSGQLSPEMWISSAFTILPFMLLGAAASQWRLIERAKQLKILWGILAVAGLTIGVFLKFQIYDQEYPVFGYGLGALFGGPILATGYAATLVLIALIPGAIKVLIPFRLVGRMSLTTYLMQSVIQSVLFYSFGFGLYGKLSMENLMIIAITIYILQIAFAWIWLSFFKQGPVEMVWKRITYGKTTENRGN